MIKKNNKQIGLVNKEILPDEYQRIEYIESDGVGSSSYGRQYINTGFVPASSGFKVNVVFKQTSENNNTGCFVYGAYNSTDGYKPSLYVYASTRKLGVYFNASTGKNTNIVCNLDEDQDVTITTVGANINYNINGATGSITTGYNQFNNNTPITLFTSYDGNTYVLKCQIKRFKAYDENSVLVRDMYPCYRKSDNKTGMYDIVNNVFYPTETDYEFATGNATDAIDKIYKGNQLVFEQGFDRTAQGVPPITVQNALHKNLKDYKVYGKADAGTLPSEYQRVEYIENTDSAYINTGLIGKPGYTLETKLNYSALATGSYQYFAGYAYTGSNDRIYFIRMANTSDNLGYTYGSNNTGTTAYTTLNTNTWYKFKSVMQGGLQELYLDDVRLGGTTQAALSYDADNPKYIYMFTSQYVNSTNGATNAKCQYAKWYDENNILIRDFVPCYRKYDGEIGMYDKVEGVFYTNQGSGSFLKGNDVTETPTINNEIPIYGVGEKTKNMINVPQSYTFTGYPNLTDYIEDFELNVEYRVSWTKTTKGSTYAPAMNLGGNVGWLQSMGADGGSKTFTYTTLPTSIYIYSNGSNASRSVGVTSSVEGLMITKSSETTDYEAYGYKIPINVNGKSTKAYVDRPLYKIGDKADYIDYKNQKVIRNVGELICNGQENWDGGTDFFRFKISSSNVVDGNISFTEHKCNYAEGKSVTVSGGEIGASVYYSSGLGGTYFRIRPDVSVGSPSTFKTLMQQYYASGHPLKAYYPLKSSTETSITLPEVLLDKGQNIIKTDTNVVPSNMSIAYKRKQ